jgi:molybdate transport system substrate-binding protein
MAGLSILLCGWVSAAPTRASEERLLISVAISLKPAFAEIVEFWSAAHPDAEISINAGGSSLLMQQIRRGAPVDLFISASPLEVDRLEADGLVVVGSRLPVASNSLIVVVPAGREPPSRPAELRDATWGRVAMGNPRTAPVGRYSERALAALGVLEELRPRLVLGENARQVLDYVVRGEVDAGIVYRTDARLFPEQVTEGPTIDPGPGGPPIYEAVALSDSAHPTVAAGLLELIDSPIGREILQRHGFAPTALNARHD